MQTKICLINILPICGQSNKIYLRKIKNTYLRLLGRKKVEDISSINVQTATNQLAEEEYGYRSIREALSVLNDCFEAAIMNRMIPVNPCKDIFVQLISSCHNLVFRI